MPNTTTNQNSPADHSSMLHYIEALERKQDKYLEMMDKTYTTHMVILESKLDQIVELAKAVSTLQAEQASNTRELYDIKISYKEMLIDHKDTFNRINSRVDEVTKQNASMDNHHQREIVKLTNALDSMDSKINTWQNRFIGGLVVAAFLIGIIQWFTVDYLDSIKSSISNTKTELSIKINELDKSLRDNGGS